MPLPKRRSSRSSSFRRTLSGRACLPPPTTTGVTNSWSSSTNPALIAWADKDRLFPREHAERLAALLPDSRLEIIEDSRTFISFDQPDRLAALITEFAGLEQTAPAPAG